MQADVLKLEEFLFKHKKVLVLTGAGISTESGNIENFYSSWGYRILLEGEMKSYLPFSLTGYHYLFQFIIKFIHNNETFFI